MKFNSPNPTEALKFLTIPSCQENMSAFESENLENKDAKECDPTNDSKMYYNKHRKEFLVKTQLGSGCI